MAMAFGGGAPKCKECAKSVYANERCDYDGATFHVECFKCLKCKSRLTPRDVAKIAGDIYCKPCFKKTFAEKGRYDSFGDKTLANWTTAHVAAGGTAPQAGGAAAFATPSTPAATEAKAPSPHTVNTTAGRASVAVSTPSRGGATATATGPTLSSSRPITTVTTPAVAAKTVSPVATPAKVETKVAAAAAVATQEDDDVDDEKVEEIKETSDAVTEVLTKHATATSTSITTLAYAESLDKVDPLRSFRREFRLPRAAPHTESQITSIYFCGNSLGPMPVRAERYVMEEFTKWGLAGVEGHFEGERPWAKIDEPSTELAAKLVGAKNASEVCILNSLSVNLHLLLLAFYRPTKERFRIIIEDGAFCSDSHVVRSQLSMAGYDPATSLIELKPREGEFTLRTEDVIATIAAEGHNVAVILLPGVQFYTGQSFDIERITAAGHAAGARVGWDLAHAAGNTPLHLHKWNVDFAAWCSYKYLSSGPGSISGIFVHERHASITGAQGWWGQQLADRFAMRATHTSIGGAQGFALSNPAVLPTVCLQASLELHVDAARSNRYRNKSLKLTGLLEYLLRHEGVIAADAASATDNQCILITPSDPSQRGCQLSLLTKRAVKPVNKWMASNGVICDVREPNVMRVAPHPLFNTFAEVHRFVHLFKQALSQPL